MQTIKEQNFSQCLVCKKNNFNFITEGYDYEYETCKNQWSFYKCNHCNLFNEIPRPHYSELNIIYPKKYYSFNYDDINFFAKKGKELLDFLKFKKILKKKNFNTFLDIGCGDGRYISMMHKKFGLKKNNCFGTDFSNPKLVSLEKQGYNIFYGTFEKFIKQNKNKFDLITLFHVIEHVPNPDFVIKKIEEILTDDGMLILETPNHDSIDAKIFKRKYWGGYHIPRHFSVFDEKSIKYISNNNNLEIESIDYITGHYFWCMSFFNYIKDNFSFFKFLSCLFNPFKLTGLPMLIFFTAIDIIRSKLKFKTSCFLISIKKKSFYE